MSQHPDRAMRAVRRVRALDVEASQRALLAARQEAARAESALEKALDRYEAVSHEQEPLTGSDLMGRLARASMLRDEVGGAHASHDQAQRSTYGCLQEWQSDKTKLKAIDSILDRRAEQRRREALRAESKELDELSQRYVEGADR